MEALTLTMSSRKRPSIVRLSSTSVCSLVTSRLAMSNLSVFRLASAYYPIPSIPDIHVILRPCNLEPPLPDVPMPWYVYAAWHRPPVRARSWQMILASESIINDCIPRPMTASWIRFRIYTVNVGDDLLNNVTVNRLRRRKLL